MSVQDLRIEEWHLYYAVSLDSEQRNRVVQCVNACAGQNIEDVKLATEHKNACMEWERLMQELIGADGLVSVQDAIIQLKAYKESAAELRQVLLNLVSQDGITPFNKALIECQQKLYALQQEMQNIRKHIGADDNKSTYDEVVRLTNRVNKIA